jgi:hypothetical protein
MGSPELGFKTLSAYADEARVHGRIVTQVTFGRLDREAPDFEERRS